MEGASDVHTLTYCGEPAVGVPGANHWRDERDARLLDSIDTIYVVREPDKGGDTLAARIGSSILRERVRFVHLGEHKDPSGLWLAGPDPVRFRAAWQAALQAAVPWTAEASREQRERASEALAACRDLLVLPSILDAFAAALATRGVVGEGRLVKLLYLATTSRLLARPASIVVKGPSSGSKSHATEKVLEFFPPECFYALSAISERALAYSEEPLKHRMLVIYEAAGLAGDFATYLMRSLLSEGRVRYETVEKTSDGLKARLIEREGPTGLLVTTTAVHLHPENETRMLSLTVSDSREQTAAVLRTLADREAAPSESSDLTAWHALQTWLAGNDNRVTIPYARALAEAIPPVAVRLRRDFRTLLTLIEAHAVLHQFQRERDATGRIVATLADYGAVRELVADLLSDAAEQAVPPAVRETVNAVAALLQDGGEHVQVVQLAAALKLDKSAAARRVRQAVDKGYLKNLEEKKGRPARLVVGEMLPDDLELLPTPDALDSGCTVAVVQGGIDTPSPLPANRVADAEAPRRLRRVI